MRLTPSIHTLFLLAAGTGCAVHVEDNASGDIRTSTQRAQVDDDSAIGTAYLRANNRDDWYFMTTSPLEGTTSQVVILGAPTGYGSDPLTTRIGKLHRDDVGGRPHLTGFTVKLHEWLYLDGAHSVQEKVPYFAMKAPGPGGEDFNDGEAHIHLHPTRITNVDHNWKHHTFLSLEEPPLIFATQMTDNGSDPATVRIRNVTTTGFDIRLQEEAGGTRSYKEDVGVLIVPNNINLRLHDPEGDGQCVWLKSTKVSANHNWNETNVRAGNLATFVTVPQTFNGSDAAGARYLTYKKPCSGFCLNDDYVKVKVDEEGSNGERLTRRKRWEFSPQTGNPACLTS